MPMSLFLADTAPIRATPLFAFSMPLMLLLIFLPPFSRLPMPPRRYAPADAATEQLTMIVI